MTLREQIIHGFRVLDERLEKLVSRTREVSEQLSNEDVTNPQTRKLALEQNKSFERQMESLEKQLPQIKQFISELGKAHIELAAEMGNATNSTNELSMRLAKLLRH